MSKKELESLKEIEIPKDSIEDFRKTVPKQEVKHFMERKIASAGLRILRFIARKGGAIEEKTFQTELTQVEREATKQLREFGWLKEEEGIWRSGSYSAAFLFLGTIIGIVGVFFLSNIFSIAILKVLSGGFAIFVVLFAIIALVILGCAGTFYSHRFKKIKLPKKTINLLVKWSKATGTPAKYYGAMEGEEEERIRGKVLERLQKRKKPRN